MIFVTSQKHEKIFFDTFYIEINRLQLRTGQTMKPPRNHHAHVPFPPSNRLGSTMIAPNLR